MSDYQYGFRSVDQFGTSLVGDQLEANLYAWLQWGLLGVGAFSNVELSSTSAHGAKPLAKLRPVSDPRVTAGKVWEAVRSDWVWESGVPYDTQPIQISGVYVANTFVPLDDTGVYQHRINYPEGQVVFTNALPTGTDVRVEHSHRHVHVRRADEPWFQAVVFRSFRADDPQFTSPGGTGGSWDILAQNRVQLPALVLEPVDRVRMRPLEIGSFARIHQQDFLVHVLAETPWDKRRLHDMLVGQYDKRIPAFDRNGISFPLDRLGAPVAGARTYPQLVEQAPWRQIRVADVQSTPQEPLGSKFFWTTIRYTLEVDVP